MEASRGPKQVTSVMEKQAFVSETSVSSHDVLPTADELEPSRSSVSSAGIWSVHAPRAMWGGTRIWKDELARRLRDLAALPSGWDMSSADALRPAAVYASLRALTDLDDYIQSAPIVSIRDDGGLLCAWGNSYCSVDIDADADGQLSIYFQDHVARTDWEGALEGALNVEKWLWQASAPLG